MLILDYDLVNNRIKTAKETEIDYRLGYHSMLLNQRLINGRQDWDITDALSHEKSNCIEWIPIKKNEKVLEIGAGYGSITEKLSDKGAEVYALETDFVKCQMIEKRTSVNANVTVVLGHLDELKEEVGDNFSKIFIVGNFYRVADYISDSGLECDDYYSFAINQLFSLLADDGQLILVDDNRLGLKYFNGAKVSDKEVPFSQVEGNSSTKEANLLFSKKEITDLLYRCDNKLNISFYYPYPDYKYTDTIYSDSRMPRRNELNYDMYNWERFGLNNFRDSLVFNSIIDEGLFDRFTNSYIAIVSKNTITGLPVYIKYSNDRSYKYQIRTEIWNSNGTKTVKKIALNSSVIKHLRKMSDTCNMSKDVLRDLDCDVKLCELRDSKDAVEYDFIEGSVLSDEVNDYIVGYDYTRVEQIFDRLFNVLAYKEVPWVPSEQFSKIFGEYDVDKALHSSRINNIDLILPNIIVTDDQKWSIIDYEWGFNVDIPAEFILWRSIFYLNRRKDASSYDEKWRKDLYKHFGIDDDLSKMFLNMEKSFQKYVSKGNVPIRELRPSSTNIQSRSLGEYFVMKADNHWDVESRKKIDSIVAVNGRTHYTINLKYNECKAIRIDPSSSKCVLHINSVTNGYGVKLNYETNCTRRCGNGNYLYMHTDPQIIIKDMDKIIDKVELDYEILNLPAGFVL